MASKISMITMIDAGNIYALNFSNKSAVLSYNSGIIKGQRTLTPYEMTTALDNFRYFYQALATHATKSIAASSFSSKKKVQPQVPQVYQDVPLRQVTYVFKKKQETRNLIISGR